MLKLIGFDTDVAGQDTVECFTFYSVHCLWDHLYSQNGCKSYLFLCAKWHWKLERT